MMTSMTAEVLDQIKTITAVTSFHTIMPAGYDYTLLYSEFKNLHLLIKQTSEDSVDMMLFDDNWTMGPFGVKVEDIFFTAERESLTIGMPMTTAREETTKMIGSIVFVGIAAFMLIAAGMDVDEYKMYKSLQG